MRTQVYSAALYKVLGWSMLWSRSIRRTYRQSLVVTINQSICPKMATHQHLGAHLYIEQLSTTFFNKVAHCKWEFSSRSRPLPVTIQIRASELAQQRSAHLTTRWLPERGTGRFRWLRIAKRNYTLYIPVVRTTPSIDSKSQLACDHNVVH